MSTNSEFSGKPPLNLEAYFARIGYSGPVEPSLAVLNALHRCHTLAVPFENLDVQLGVDRDTSIEAAYDKIVKRRRGGWCYEQNGLLGAVLSQLGFDVVRLAAGVMMHERGDQVFGNHLCLMVRSPDSEQDWLVDVGYGGSLLEPIPIEAGEHEQSPYSLDISSPRNGWIRFSENFVDDSPFCFDFQKKTSK